MKLTGILRGMLARYNEVPGRLGEYAEMVDSPRQTFFWMLTLEMGVTQAEAQLKWAESVIRRIKNKEHPTLEHPKM